MRLTSDELYAFFEKELEKKQAFFVDWKFSACDVAYNVKLTIPNLDISWTPETQVYGDWIEKVTIEGQEYSINFNSDSLIWDVIEKVNRHLAPKNQTLISWIPQDDNVSFILIKLDKLPEYEEMGFCKI